MNNNNASSSAAKDPSPTGLLGRALATAAVLALLWVVYGMVAAGNPLWAVAALVIGGLAIWVYTASTSLAWRYLFPGVAAMIIFIAFPLLYTVQIGFTNYSASNLLTEDRARAYLLDQADIDEAHAMSYTVHRAGTQVRLALQSDGESGAQRWVSPPLDLSKPLPADATADAAAVALAPANAGTDAELGEALDIRGVIALRDGLRSLKLQVPGGAVLAYAGLREFGPFTPVWQAQPDGGLKQVATGLIFTPDHNTGYFTNAQAGRLQPGFKVGVGLANYTRLFGDPDMRGPFASIFIWTVVFAGLTVVFSTAIGMTLAVLLNWEALKYRTLYRTLLFLPYAVPGFISILVFKGLFNQNFGEINAILDAAFGIKPAWFADPTLAKSMLLIVNTWLGYPYFLVLCTGLIKAIPADLYEASAIAGAKPLTNFFKITAPLIVKPLTPLLISAFAFNFNNFVLISLLTDGRPDYLNTKLPAGTTDILVSYTYRIAFTDAGANFGLAAAISTVIFFLVALLSLANLKLTQSNDQRKA
ncbi:MAG: maltose ABC transporter permease MalF [Burkholderiales bacterium PBB6]|nr:MAG: maltose ABC transporter permease MalF [Burkholderiales bacterium PBB6]